MLLWQTGDLTYGTFYQRKKCTWTSLRFQRKVNVDLAVNRFYITIKRLPPQRSLPEHQIITFFQLEQVYCQVWL